MSLPRESLPTEVLAALQRGQLIEAIKLLRQAKGLGLKESKALLDHHRNPSAARNPRSARAGSTTAAPAAQPSVPGALPPAAVAALQEGRKMEAIRVLVMESGMGLAEARRTVEAHGGSNPGLDSGLAPGEVPRTESKLWVWVVLLLVGYLLYRLLSA